MLTQGSIQQIINKHRNIKPILQILDIGTITRANLFEGEIIRLVVSDGHLYLQAMIARNAMNYNYWLDMVHSKKLKRYTTIKVTEYDYFNIGGKHRLVIIKCYFIQQMNQAVGNAKLPQDNACSAPQKG